jgi:hypothetical protein
MQTPTAAALSAAACAALLALAGCGGGGGASTTGATTAPPTATTKTKPQGAGKHAKQQPANQSPSTKAHAPGPPAAAFEPEPHHDSGGGSRQFIVKGADNSVQEFGAEAPDSELDQAAAALHGFLDARAERNWAAACTYLSAQTKRAFVQLGGSTASQGCAAALSALSGDLPTATLREAAVADVGSLRRQATRGFLIYRGAPKGTVYAIPLAREGRAWKIASLAGTPLN